MAFKIGEAFYEVYPKINRAAAAAAKRLLGRDLSDEFGKANAEMRSESDKTAKTVIGNEKTVDQSREKNYKRETLRNNALNRLLVNHSDGRLKIAKKEEGFLHHLATQFRTIGTLARGIGLGAGLLSGFSILQGALGAIIAAGPIAAAAIALIPEAIAAVAVEAIILKGAFKGVGSAITDAFDPSQAKKFNEELQKLSPAARTFVLNIKKAAGILPNIQQTFFSSESLQAASRQIAPFFQQIKANFKSLISANGDLFGGLLSTITNPVNGSSINSFLASLARIIREITPGLNVFVSGFVTFLDHLGVASSGTAISNFLANVGNFLSRVNVKDLFKDANAGLGGFVLLLKTAGTVVGGIIKAFGGTDHLGQQFFQNLGGILNNISAFVNSGTGQTFLTDLVGTLNVLSSLANTVIKDGLSFIAGVFSGLYPSIKPFVDVVKKILNDVFTPQLGKTLGEIASHLLDTGTAFLNYVEPGIKAVFEFVNAHPGVIEGLAKAVLALWLAMKIKNGITEIAVGFQAIKLALDWFGGKGPGIVAANMGGIAAGETAMGAAGETAAAGGITSLTSKLGLLLGKGGIIVGGLLVVQELTDKFGSLGDKVGDALGIGKKGDTITNSPFTRAMSDLGKKLGLVDSNGQKATDTIKNFKFAVSQGELSTNPPPSPGGKAPGGSTSGTPAKPGTPGGGATQSQQNNLKNITPQAFAITGPIKTLTTAFDGLNTSINGTLKTAGLWSKNFPSNITTGITTVGATVKTFGPNFTTPIQQQFNIVTTAAKTTWANVNTNTATGIATVGKTLTTTLGPAIVTPVQTQYNIVQTKTTALWTNVHQTTATGVANTGLAVSGLGNVLTVPVKKTYNQVITASVNLWNNVGKQFVQGVRNMGTNTSQIVKAVTPGVQGLVKTYTENVKKVWDAVAKPLSLAVLPAVGFAAAGVSVANVPNSPVQTPVFVRDGGPIAGPGGPREDKVAAWLSNGEFVVNAKQTAKYRPLLTDINNGKKMDVNWSYKDGGYHDANSPRFAGGGAYAPKGTRSGRSYPQIEQFVRMMNGGKSLRVSATTGGGHINNSYHYSGEAVDWVGGNLTMAKVAQQLWSGYSRYFLELIHSPKWFAHNGIKETAAQGKRTYQAVYSGHFGHIHTAMTKEGVRAAIAAANGNGIVGGSGADPLAVGLSDAQIKSIRDATAKNIPGKTTWDEMMRQTILGKLTRLQKVTTDKAASLNGNNIRAGSGQINSWISQASHFASIPTSWLPWLRYIIDQESGGNPRAINRTDINAQQGHPSQGLMQLIPSNFAAYHDGAPNDILNPVSNIVAGINYIKARYGTIFQTPWARGTGTYYKDGGYVDPTRVFDRGGTVGPGWNHIYNATGRPEVLANVTDGQQMDVNLNVNYNSEEGRRLINVEIDKNTKRLTRVLTSRRGG